jgi:hypothetical protein
MKPYELKGGYYDGKIIHVPEQTEGHTVHMPLISLGDSYLLIYRKKNDQYVYEGAESTV